MTRPLKDSDPKKWEYAFHIFVKHTLFKKYFEAWSKILGMVFKDIGYLDGFAGRGKYINTRRHGSPILALRTLTENEHYFGSCQCIFVEKDTDNFETLRKILKKKENEISHKISIECRNKEFSKILPYYLKSLSEKPFFVFLDPFGFKGLPLNDIKEILTRGENEVFITLMTKNINRFLNSDTHRNALRDLMGGDEHLMNLNG